MEDDLTGERGTVEDSKRDSETSAPSFGELWESRNTDVNFTVSKFLRVNLWEGGGGEFQISRVSDTFSAWW